MGGQAWHSSGVVGGAALPSLNRITPSEVEQNDLDPVVLAVMGVATIK
jgi:hypothetical protein